MRIPRAFIGQPLASGAELELTAATSHYLQNVLRLKPQSKLTVFNGEGGEYQATITECRKKSVSIRLGDYLATDVESPLRIHLGIGLSRGERMDMVVQKATELGVAEISPLFTERCEVRLEGQRLQKRRDHWQKIMIGACEQSGRNRLPGLNLPRELGAFVTDARAPLKLIMHPGESAATALSHSELNAIDVLIGPEGGFSEQEVQSCVDQGFDLLSLGPRILRTETAPLAALSILQYRWGDLS